jgi:hypothetical protein
LCRTGEAVKVRSFKQDSRISRGCQGVSAK